MEFYFSSSCYVEMNPPGIGFIHLRSSYYILPSWEFLRVRSSFTYCHHGNSIYWVCTTLMLNLMLIKQAKEPCKGPPATIFKSEISFLPTLNTTLHSGGGLLTTAGGCRLTKPPPLINDDRGDSYSTLFLILK